MFLEQEVMSLSNLLFQTNSQLPHSIEFQDHLRKRKQKIFTFEMLELVKF